MDDSTTRSWMVLRVVLDQEVSPAIDLSEQLFEIRVPPLSSSDEFDRDGQVGCGTSSFERDKLALDESLSLVTPFSPLAFLLITRSVRNSLQLATFHTSPTLHQQPW